MKLRVRVLADGNAQLAEHVFELDPENSGFAFTPVEIAAGVREVQIYVELVK